MNPERATERGPPLPTLPSLPTLPPLPTPPPIPTPPPPTPAQVQAALAANSIRIGAVADRLSVLFKTVTRLEPMDFSNLCVYLARGIDYATTNNDIPPTAHILPSILKQVYQRKHDSSLQYAIMMLMISAKTACNNGWFPVADAHELLSMTKELFNSFCTEVSINTEAGNTLDWIMPRFYPQLKLGHLIVSFEAKRGYNVLLTDFHIKKNLPSEERIVLFVVQTDNLETSSCIISPPEASFLINGKGVEKRTNNSMESGPQFPTDITKMLKYGTNIIQAVGYFKGNYMIAIAFVSKINLCTTPILKDYVQPTRAVLASDSEIIEGSSRISLNCPISFKRIKTPVKGRFCKHLQCFDYNNFLEINSRNPTWRCPCCNQSTSFIDLHVDQNMVKILGDVMDDVSGVVIDADGTWNVTIEDIGTTVQPDDRLPDEQQSNRSINTLSDAVDLTMEEDGDNGTPNGFAIRSRSATCDIKDTNLFKGIQGFPVSRFPFDPPLGNCTTMTTQPAAYQFLSSTSASNESSNPRGPVGSAVGTLESIIPDFLLNPVVTREPIPSLEISEPTFSYINSSQNHPAENMLLRRSQMESPVSSGGARRPPISRNVMRTPIAIQALPVPIQTPSASRRVRTNVPFGLGNISNGSGSSYQTIHPDGFDAVRTDMEMQEIPRTSDIRATQDYYHDYRRIATRLPSFQARADAYRQHQTMSQPTIVPPQSSQFPSTQSQQASRTTASSSNPNKRAFDGLDLSDSDYARLTGGNPDFPSEQNWQPTRRMRGSLTGSAYSAALNRYMLTPNPSTSELLSEVISNGPPGFENDGSGGEPGAFGDIN